MKAFLQKYKHAWVLLYGLIYFPWFFYLEKTVTHPAKIIHMKIDDYIPFLEIFVIPYLMWFAYIAAAVLFFMIVNKKDFYKLTGCLFTGMTIFLIVSTLMPNGLNLRPTEFPRDNIFTDLVKALYSTDTSTNVTPSIHVYNSVIVNLAVMRSSDLKNKKWIRIGSFILSTLIVLSTMFIKQHSVSDVIAALAMCMVLYPIFYGTAFADSQSKKIHEASAKL